MLSNFIPVLFVGLLGSLPTVMGIKTIVINLSPVIMSKLFHVAQAAEVRNS